MKILIIEDDAVIKNELAKFLTANDYEVFTIEDFNNTFVKIEEANPHLILLDINLPINDGYTICRKLREKSDVPVIILTSRDTEMDELMSMNIGADDFVKKPFSPQILLARIERLISRVYQSKQIETIDNGQIKLNISTGIVTHQEKSETLTKNELCILNHLLKNRGKLVSRDDLMTALWSSSAFIDDNTLSVNVTRLRKKLENIGVSGAIETRRGIGYILNEI